MDIHAARWVVFVVEDDFFIRLEIVSALRDAGVEVLERRSGEDAIACLQADGDRIDALFTDINLAGRMTGWDVAQKFRSLYPGKPVVYTSGKAQDRSRQLENSVFFGKPYRTDAVVTACMKSQSQR